MWDRTTRSIPWRGTSFWTAIEKRIAYPSFCHKDASPSMLMKSWLSSLHWSNNARRCSCPSFVPSSITNIRFVVRAAKWKWSTRTSATAKRYQCCSGCYPRSEFPYKLVWRKENIDERYNYARCSFEFCFIGNLKLEITWLVLFFANFKNRKKKGIIFHILTTFTTRTLRAL